MENQGEIGVPRDEEQRAAEEGRTTPIQQEAIQNLQQQFIPRMQRKLNEEVGKKALEEGQEEIRKRALQARQEYYESHPVVEEKKESWWKRLFKR